MVGRTEHSDGAVMKKETMDWYEKFFTVAFICIIIIIAIVGIIKMAIVVYYR